MSKSVEGGGTRGRGSQIVSGGRRNKINDSGENSIFKV